MALAVDTFMRIMLHPRVRRFGDDDYAPPWASYVSELEQTEENLSPPDEDDDS